MKQQQIPLNINNFEIGDIIVRIEPAAMLGNTRDRSYIGKPFKFLGVANGCIYIEKIKKNEEETFDPENLLNIAEMFNLFMGDNKGPLSLPLDLWAEGWSLYIDPYSIGSDNLEKHFENEFKGESIRSLKAKYKQALENEEYEKAEKIRKIIDNK